MLDFEHYSSDVIIKEHGTITKQNTKKHMYIKGAEQKSHISIPVMAAT